MGHNVEQRRYTHTLEHKRHTWTKTHTNIEGMEHNDKKVPYRHTNTCTEWGIGSSKDAHQLESNLDSKSQKTYTNTTTTTTRDTCTQTNTKTHTHT